MTYIGLKNESNVRTAKYELRNIGPYWPKSHLIDDYIYVPTLNGIYRKNLDSVNDTIWSLYAFEGIPILDFAKYKDSVLAITVKTKDSLMLLSPDDGKTYINHISDFFFKNDSLNTIWLLSMNPLNHKTIFVLHNRYGPAKSVDFGNSWSAIDEPIGGYQNRFVGFNPNDTCNIFYTGEFIYFDSFIYASYDSGSSWKLTESIPSHCTHILAFHPNNPDIIVSGGEGWIEKSTDRGLTWKKCGRLNVYVTGLIYDTENPDVLYASGDFQGVSDTIKIFKSADGGDTWNLFYSEIIKNSDGVLDIHLYKNKLIIYTLVNGVYSLDLDAMDDMAPKDILNLTIYPNPSKSALICKSAELFDYVRIIDSSGKLLSEYKPDSKDFSLNISFLNKGLYLTIFGNSSKVIFKKIIKE
jgi:hypothetical protein